MSDTPLPDDIQALIDRLDEIADMQGPGLVGDACKDAIEALETAQRKKDIATAANRKWFRRARAAETTAEQWRRSALTHESTLEEVRRQREAAEAALADWQDWLEDLQEDFVGVTDSPADSYRLHTWDWIAEHRPAPRPSGECPECHSPPPKPGQDCFLKGCPYRRPFAQPGGEAPAGNWVKKVFKPLPPEEAKLLDLYGPGDPDDVTAPPDRYDFRPFPTPLGNLVVLWVDGKPATDLAVVKDFARAFAAEITNTEDAPPDRGERYTVESFGDLWLITPAELHNSRDRQRNATTSSREFAELIRDSLSTAEALRGALKKAAARAETAEATLSKISFELETTDADPEWMVKVIDEIVADAPRTSQLRDFPSEVEKLTPAAQDVLAERRRQIESEGWTPEHDDKHTDGSMALAAACYAIPIQRRTSKAAGIPSLWPWHWKWWKPRAPRRDLVKAAALLLAEIERVDRAAMAAPGMEGDDG